MDWKLSKEAEEAKKQVEEDTVEVLKFGGSDGFWYDATKGGYFKPELALADKEQIKMVKDALELLEDLEENVYQMIVPEM